MTSNAGTSTKIDDFSCRNEPTYVNDTQLLFFNNDIINICQRHDLSDNLVGSKKFRYIISRGDAQWHKYRAIRETEAAITIQRAYRLFRQRKQRKDNIGDPKGACNYIELLNECGNNRLGINSLFTTCINRPSPKNKDFGDECDRQAESKYRSEHLIDTIKVNGSTGSSPGSPNNGHMIRECQRHHVQCPLFKQRKHSVDLNRLAHPGLFAYRNNNQAQSPHSVLIYEEDLRRIRSNLYVVHTCDQQPIVMTINSNCPTHKVCRNPNNSIPRLPNCQRIISGNNQCQSAIDQDHSHSFDNTLKFSQLQKQLKMSHDQKYITEKRMYKIGLNIFNKHPVAGINYLVTYQYIKAHPSYIAKFLLTKSGISRNAIGDYLGSITDSLALQVTKFFLRRINMKNKEVDEALRSFIYYVHLPGESQKICHLMEEFKEAYLQQNELRLLFKSNETVMVLAYAIIMLQTDAHNNSIRKNEKMTLEQFITNLRGVDGDSDIDRHKLEQIYARVTGKELKTQPDHTDQVMRLNDVISGSNKPPDLVNRIRRFICYCRLSEIMDDSKKNKTDSHQREVFLFNDILLVCKMGNKSKKDDVQYQCKMTVDLADLRVTLFSTTNHLFGVQLSDRKTDQMIIKLNAQCEQDQKKFKDDLLDCIFESVEMLNINHSDYLVLSPSMRYNSPRTSPRKSNTKQQSTFQDLDNNTVPNPPRRQESLMPMDRPDLVQSLHRVRKPSAQDNDSTRLKNYVVKAPFNEFYS